MSREADEIPGPLVGVVVAGIAAFFPFQYIRGCWELAYMPWGWWYFLAPCLAIGIWLTWWGAEKLKDWRTSPRGATLLWAVALLFGGLLNLAQLNFYGNWKAIVLLRLHTQVDLKATRGLLLAEKARLEALSGQPLDWHSYHYPPTDSASLLHPAFEGFPTNYASLRLDATGAPFLMLDNGGGFLMPWGVAIGHDTLSPTDLRFSRVEQRAPGLLFFDVQGLW